MRLSKIILAAIVAAAGLTVTLYASVWLLGERVIKRQYETPPLVASHSADANIIEEGARLADVAGCTGCHGEDLNGGVITDDRFVFRWVSSNIPRLAAAYSDEDLARAIRHGVKPDQRSVIGMPSPSFYDLREEDMTAILSFIRTQKDKGGRLPRNEAFIVARLGFLQDVFPPEAALIDHLAARRFYDFSNPVEHGEYLARLACSECHGMDFDGQEGAIPDLVIAAAYPPDLFHHLMRTGEPIGGRDLDLMDEVARDRFARFTDDEINAMHAYFVHRADTMSE